MYQLILLSKQLNDLPCSTPQYRPEREKRPPCPVPAILPVFPYPGDVLEPIRVVHLSPIQLGSIPVIEEKRSEIKYTEMPLVMITIT